MMDGSDTGQTITFSAEASSSFGVRTIAIPCPTRKLAKVIWNAFAPSGLLPNGRNQKVIGASWITFPPVEFSE